MGLTPLGGIPMGTRSGDLDPSVVTYLMKKEELDADDVEEVLNRESGVYGISMVSVDFRDIEGLNFYILVYRILGFYKLFIYSLQSFRGQNLIYLGISHAL